MKVEELFEKVKKRNVKFIYNDMVDYEEISYEEACKYNIERLDIDFKKNEVKIFVWNFE